MGLVVPSIIALSIISFRQNLTTIQLKILKVLAFTVVIFFSGLSLSESEKSLDSCPNLLDHELRILDSNKTENLCKYKDKVIMVVNVASRCGFTYQYESLQKLYSKYNNEDFVILGFPSRDFMFQEYNSEDKVKEFCESTYGVSFPLFATSSVKGSKANDFYKDLNSKTGKAPSWNFTKILISKNGSETHVFSSNVEPNDQSILSKIEKLL